MLSIMGERERTQKSMGMRSIATYVHKRLKTGKSPSTFEPRRGPHLTYYIYVTHVHITYTYLYVLNAVFYYLS